MFWKRKEEGSSIVVLTLRQCVILVQSYLLGPRLGKGNFVFSLALFRNLSYMISFSENKQRMNSVRYAQVKRFEILEKLHLLGLQLGLRNEQHWQVREEKKPGESPLPLLTHTMEWLLRERPPFIRKSAEKKARALVLEGSSGEENAERQEIPEAVCAWAEINDLAQSCWLHDIHSTELSHRSSWVPVCGTALKAEHICFAETGRHLRGCLLRRDYAVLRFLVSLMDPKRQTLTAPI